MLPKKQPSQFDLISNGFHSWPKSHQTFGLLLNFIWCQEIPKIAQFGHTADGSSLLPLQCTLSFKFFYFSTPLFRTNLFRTNETFFRLSRDRAGEPMVAVGRFFRGHTHSLASCLSKLERKSGGCKKSTTTLCLYIHSFFLSFSPTYFAERDQYIVLAKANLKTRETRDWYF